MAEEGITAKDVFRVLAEGLLPIPESAGDPQADEAAAEEMFQVSAAAGGSAALMKAMQRVIEAADGGRFSPKLAEQIAKNFGVSDKSEVLRVLGENKVLSNQGKPNMYKTILSRMGSAGDVVEGAAPNLPIKGQPFKMKDGSTIEIGEEVKDMYRRGKAGRMPVVVENLAKETPRPTSKAMTVAGDLVDKTVDKAGKETGDGMFKAFAKGGWGLVKKHPILATLIGLGGLGLSRLDWDGEEEAPLQETQVEADPKRERMLQLRKQLEELSKPSKGESMDSTDKVMKQLEELQQDLRRRRTQ